jgi:CTD kinase subunit alpha
MYTDRKRYEEERNEHEKHRLALEKLAQGESENREELALQLDAEMKHRVALEQQYHEQEELSKALAAKQLEENRQLNEALQALELAKAQAKAAAEQHALDRRMHDEHERLARKQAQDRADLSKSVLDIRQRRSVQDEAIAGQLEAQLERSRHGLHRSNLLLPSPSLLPHEVAGQPGRASPQVHHPQPELPKKSDPAAPHAAPSAGDGEVEANAQAEERDEGAKSPLLLYSTAALRSISNAATSWSSHAWGLFGKLTSPLFASSLNTRVHLGRVRKPSLTSGCSFVEFSAPKIVKKVIPLPKYRHLIQNTQRITPEERNINAEYFYRFREPMILSLINHPNILHFYSPLVTADQSIVLESPMVQYDLSFYAAEMLVGPAEEVLDKIRVIITQLLLAVQYLHTLSVYHLNIKPTSILIHQPTPQDPIVALLTSFSKARARGSHDSFVATLDLADMPHGLSYMSPQFAEVADAALAGLPSSRIEFAATDVWSVGCVLVSLLARGCDLFGGPIKRPVDLIAKARLLNADMLHKFVADSMRRRRRSDLPDLANAPQFASAIRLATQLLAFDPSQRLSALDALHSPFISLNQDIVPPRVLESFDDEALPMFALIHRGVSNRNEIIQPDD